MCLPYVFISMCHIICLKIMFSIAFRSVTSIQLDSKSLTFQLPLYTWSIRSMHAPAFPKLIRNQSSERLWIEWSGNVRVWKKSPSIKNRLACVPLRRVERQLGTWQQSTYCEHPPSSPVPGLCWGWVLEMANGTSRSFSMPGKGPG